MASDKRGVLVIISSPSGAGKTTLARRLLQEFSGMEFSVSYTTRSPRPNERDHVDYHFVSDEQFDVMIGANEFAEWAHVHGNRYGTSRSAVETALVSGRDVVFDVDWQGGRALSASWPQDCLTIFILPPDWKTLADRLRRRATDSEEVIQRRLDKAREELEHHAEYRHLVLNDNLDQAYQRLRAIYLVHRHGAEDRPDASFSLEELAAGLTEDDELALRGHAVVLVQAAREGQK